MGKEPPRKYLPHLDGLRAIGCIYVIFYHMGFTVFRHAWLCISLFFSLSGILITSITVDAFEKHGAVDVVRFWSRRVGRLFPIFLVCVLIICIVTLFQDLDSEDQFYLRGDLIWGVFYMENVHLIKKKEDYFAGWQKPSIVRHIWTLAIEEQYYAVWPILFSLWIFCFMGFKTPKKLKEMAVNNPRAGQVKGKDEEEGSELLNRGDSIALLPDGKASTILEETATTKLQQPTENETVSTEKQGYEDDPRFRRCLYALCVGEVLIMLFSYLSSFPTIETMGMSAAYFSTWSRCGDFAAGGLVYLMVHLNPSVKKRYKKEGTLEPMTTKHRILLEIGITLCVLLVTIPATFQVPLDDALDFYFYYFRIPFSLFAIGLSVPGALQLSETPLPRWALTTRFLSCKIMTILGIASYGAYIVHWPLILWFGDPMNHAKFEDDPNQPHAYDELDEDALDPTLALLRDYGIAIASLTLGTISFFFFEQHMMVLAAKQKPWKVLVIGLASCIVVSSCVVLVTPDAKDPHVANKNDYEALLAQSLVDPPAGPQPSVLDLFPDSGPSHETSEDFIPTHHIEDDRYTPVAFMTHTSSGLSIADILDANTKPKTYINYQPNNYHGDAWPKHTPVPSMFDSVTAKSPPQTIIFFCKALLIQIPFSEFKPGLDVDDHPCHYHWQQPLTFVWVTSNVLCSRLGDVADDAVYTDETLFPEFFEATCPHKMTMYEVDLPDYQMWETPDPDFDKTYSGRQDRDAFILMEMLLTFARAEPGIINKASVATFEEIHEKNRIWIEQMAEYVGPDGKFVLPEIGSGSVSKWEIMGDSVANKIGVIMQEIPMATAPCEASQNPDDRIFPVVQTSNLGEGGAFTLIHYIPCEHECAAMHSPECNGLKIDCQAKDYDYDHRQVVQHAIELVKPDYLILQDGHWAAKLPEEEGLTYEANYLSMEVWMKQAHQHGVRHIVLQTHSPFKRDTCDYQLDGYREVIRRNKCHEGRNRARIKVTIFHWHLLVCPDYYEVTECSQRQHGFEKILGDRNHPKGPAGNWLVGNFMASMLLLMAHDMQITSTDDIYNDPFMKCLTISYPPDHEPELEDLLETAEVCLE